MSYFAKFTARRPYFELGRLVDFIAKVPDVHRRVYISSIFTDGLTTLDPAETPEHLALDNPLVKTLADMFQSQDGVCVVSRALRDLMEGLDPGLHQFLPIMLDGSSQAGERFILNVHIKQDSVVVGRTNAQPVHGAAGTPAILRLGSFLKAGDITVDVSRLGKANAWRESRCLGALLFSDSLHDQIKQQKLRVLPLLKCETSQAVAS